MDPTITPEKESPNSTASQIIAAIIAKMRSLHAMELRGGGLTNEAHEIRKAISVAWRGLDDDNRKRVEAEQRNLMAEFFGRTDK